MSRKRLGRLQRAATIIPLALLSAAWTASVAGIGGITPPVSAEQGPDTSLDDGTSVPSEAIEAPASVSDPTELSPDGNTQDIVATASTNQIPSAALAAYQRAEAVINKADKTCHLTWQLVAAIGRVESNHGRSHGSVLDNDGVARPGIYGKPLNGRNGAQAISDTDAGQFDHDARWDRAIGPMQFIPSTWSIVGVDADGDSKRNPQDIDDAALATAVYLCSGKDDLSTTMGQRAAVYRYNHSQAYVDLVMDIMNAYLEGDFTTIPNNTLSAGYIVPEPPAYNPGTHNGADHNISHHTTPADSSDDGGYVPPTDGTTDPGDTGGDGGTGDGGNGGTGGGNGGLPSIDHGGPVDHTLGQVDHTVSNLLHGVLGALAPSAVRGACADKYPSTLQVLQYTNCVLSYGLNP